MKSVITLIKLYRQRVRHQKVRMARLEEQLSGLEADKRSCEASLEYERTYASKTPEAGVLFAQYAEAMRHKITEISGRIKDSRVQYEQEQNRLQRLFQEAKTMEIVEERRETEEEYQNQLLAQKRADELFAARLFLKRRE